MYGLYQCDELTSKEVHSLSGMLSILPIARGAQLAVVRLPRSVMFGEDSIGKRASRRSHARTQAGQAALTAAGCHRAVLGHPNGSRRVWPQGWTGSLAQGGDIAVAVVCPLDGDAQLLGVGIDIEPVDSLRFLDRFPRAAFAPEESDAFRRGSGDDGSSIARFVVKEAVFKCLPNRLQVEYPLRRIVPFAEPLGQGVCYWTVSVGGIEVEALSASGNSYFSALALPVAAVLR